MNQDNVDTRESGFSDVTLERFLLDELDAAGMEKVRRAADGDERLRRRLEALQQSNREILETYPPGWAASQIERRLRAQTAARPRRRWFSVWLTKRALVPAAVAIVLAVLVIPRVGPPGDQTVTVAERVKGAPSQLYLYRESITGSEHLRDGDHAWENDRILLQYQVTGPGFGAILSMDGRGAVTRHLPEHAQMAMEMEPGPPRSLDYAYELDDAPDWEVFVFVTASQAFAVETVIRALENSLRRTQPDSLSRNAAGVQWSIALPDDFSVTTFTLVKDPTP